MKRQLAIALGLAVVSTSALASKARLEALGQDANGSQVVDDHRSIFLNAAHLNHHKDFATFEFGDTSNAVDQRANAVGVGPRAEGGVFQSSGNMVYGLYFGEESNTVNGYRTVAEMNNTTVFFAGDAGVQWGASILFGSYDNETNDAKASQTRARFGVISGNIDAFLNMGLGNTYEAGAVKEEGKSSMDIGITYNQGDANYMLRSQKAEIDDDGTDKVIDYLSVGASKEYKLNDKARMWASAFYEINKSENVFAAGERTVTQLPVNMALEVSANDWLALRASISQNVFVNTLDNDTDVNTQDDTTSTAFGASFVYGDLSVDAMVGGTNEDTSTSGEFGSDDMLHRVSMTYNF